MADLVVIAPGTKFFLSKKESRVTSTGEQRVTSTGELRVI